MVLNTITHNVLYYDSLGDINYSSRALYYIRQWMKCELLRLTQSGTITTSRTSAIGDPDLWSYHVNPSPSPRQNNSYDCGVYYLATILYHIQGRTPNYTHTHIPTIRKQFVMALLTSQIPSPFAPLAVYDSSLDFINLRPAAPLLLSLHPPSVSQPSRVSHPSPHDSDNGHYEYYSVHITGGGARALSPHTSHPLPLLIILEYTLYYPP